MTKFIPDGHVKGRYMEVLTRPVLDEKKENIRQCLSCTREVYSILFSKSAVDEVIKNSECADKSNIRFVVCQVCARRKH